MPAFRRRWLLPAREGIARDLLPAYGLGVSPGNGCVHLCMVYGSVFCSLQSSPSFRPSLDIHLQARLVGYSAACTQPQRGALCATPVS